MEAGKSPHPGSRSALSRSMSGDRSLFNNFHPIGRIGQPQDVGPVIDFLLSDDASWVTGAI